jgi:phosphoglycerate dehydrogenase-like enzyme
MIVSNDLARLREAAPEADVILNGDFRDPSLLLQTFPHALNVRWVHALSAGVESILSPEILASPVPLTNGRGVFRTPLAEWVVAAMLHFSYDLRRIQQQQEAGVWEPFDVDELNGKTLGIVGYGEIGRSTADRARPFGMKILATRRKASDGMYPPSRVKEMLAQCDYVAVCTPLTPETRGLIGPAEIAVMKSSAVIINVGRGPVIDEAALIAALESGKIRGAALDVFDVEPLSAGHPFYRMKNVLLSPHSADHTPGWRHRAVQCFLDNFERFSKGEPLQNIVDKHAGY